MQQGRMVVVTGAGGGIGGKIVDRFIANGDRVVGLDQEESSLKDLVASRSAGNQLSTSCVDISDAAEVATFAEQVEQTHSRCDVLVNCGGFYIAPVALEDEAAVGKQFVEAAKQAGVRRVVFSSGIHPGLSELSNHAGTAPVEEALLDSGMEYVFLQPAMFFQNLSESWSKVKETGVYGEPWSTETRFTRVDYRDVAEVVAIALTEDRLIYGTFELCAEGNLNRHDLVAMMTEVLSRPVRAIKVEPSALKGVIPKLLRMFSWNDYHALLGNSNTLRAILGREPRSLRAFLEELNANGLKPPVTHTAL